MQQQVANHTTGHAKVLAAAGSGKTTTMVARVINLVEGGVNPARILSVMFNRDARDGYHAKLLLTFSKQECPPVFTFHGIGSSLLKQLVKDKLVPQGRLETSEYKLMMAGRDAIDPWIAQVKGWRPIVGEFLSFVDLVKNSLGTPAEVFKEYDLPASYRYFIDGFKAFEKNRQRQGIWYFGDLIYEPVKYLLANRKVAKRHSGQYDHIIVDEFQDISDIQMAMVKLLAGGTAHVMAVGDDDQCIYTWRGAKPEYLVRGFDQHFSSPAVYELTETFRYGHQLALAASYLIKNNVTRAPKLCIASARSRKTTTVALDVDAVAIPTVPKHVRLWQKGGRSLTEVAVLVRSYSHAVQVELALLNAGIPYRVEGGTPLFEADDIGSLVAGIHLAAGSYNDMQELQKRKLVRFFFRHPSMALPYELERELLEEAFADLDDPAAALDGLTYKVREQWMRERLHRRASCWRNFITTQNLSLPDLIDYVMNETGVRHHIQYVAKNADDVEEMLARYESFAAYAAHTGMSVAEFSQHLISLVEGGRGSSGGDSILITSVHRSKGLEWPFVIMPGLSQGKFPYIPKSGDKPYSIEDERRLFYVGMTRAQEKLVMITPNDGRLKRHLGSGSDQPPREMDPDPACASQFIYETNLFLSQRADALVSGKEKIPAGIKSDGAAKAYLQSLNQRDRAKA